MIRCYFEKDIIGIYLLPLIGYSNEKGARSIWFGFLNWLVVFPLNDQACSELMKRAK